MLRILMGCIIAALFGCSPVHEPGTAGKNSDVDDQDVSIEKLLGQPQAIVFADVQKLVLKVSCDKCHSGVGARAGIDTSSYQSITQGFGGGPPSVVAFAPQQSSLFNTLVAPQGPRRMPPSSEKQLSEMQVNLIYQWIINGAKEEATEVPERPPTLAEELQPYFSQPEKIDYLLVNKYVFEVSCNRCHSENGATANQDNAILYGHDMTTYETTVDREGVVYDKNGKPKLENFLERREDGSQKLRKGSRLYRSIVIDQTMPPASGGFEPIDSLRMKLLRYWLMNCAIKDYSKIDPATDDLEEKPKNGQIRNCPEPAVE